MSDDEQPEVEVGPVTKVARDLTEILELNARLLTQAVSKANAKVDGTGLPGGAAMVALAPAASHEAWENMNQASERYGLAYTSAEDEDPEDAWSPFQQLDFWAEQWRTEHGMEFEPTPHRPRPTIASEANFIRWALNWAWDNEAHWDDFAADVNRARVKLEGILYAGRRQERTRIICSECEAAPRLIVLRGHNDDSWKCPGCKHRFDADAVQRAHAKMLRSEGAERWLHQIDAIGLLKAQGRPERTVRAWLADGEGSGYCDPKTHEVWVWWPDLWRKHLVTPTRNRGESA